MRSSPERAEAELLFNFPCLEKELKEAVKSLSPPFVIRVKLQESSPLSPYKENCYVRIWCKAF